MKTSHLMQQMLRAAGVAVVAMGSLVATQSAMAAISNTKHNLGGASNSNSFSTAGAANGEICVFCHTPHASDTSAPVPLWNKKLAGSSTTYNTYENLGGVGSPSIDGNFATDGPTSSSNGKAGKMGSVSLACLSCHDGTQAMDNVLNAPGFGNYDSTGGGTAGRAFAITSSIRMNSAGQMLNGAATVAMLGTDLTNDHPIGISYCGWKTVAPTDNSKTNCGDQDFNAPRKGTGNLWWVDTTAGTAGTREKTDMALYTRVAGGVTGPFVECASCHDPHVEQKSTNEVAFLRLTNVSSQVCLACHAK